MKLFKTRLISLGLAILFMAVIFGVATGSYALLALIHPLAPIVVMMAACAVVFVVYVITSVYSFVKWLFIEPFRKGRDE